MLAGPGKKKKLTSTEVEPSARARYSSPLQWSIVTKNSWVGGSSQKVMILPALGFLRFLAR